MGADWRGHSVLEYEDEGSLDGEPPRYRWHLGCILLKMPAISLLTGGHLFFSAGGPTWETVAALAVAGEDPAAPHEHGPVRVALGGASNLSALREEIVSWYTGAVKRGQPQVQLVLCVHTAGSTGAKPVEGVGERGGGAATMDLVRAVPKLFRMFTWPSDDSGSVVVGRRRRRRRTRSRRRHQRTSSCRRCCSTSSCSASTSRSTPTMMARRGASCAPATLPPSPPLPGCCTRYTCPALCPVPRDVCTVPRDV